MTTYSVKEAFVTLQGEGRHAGRTAVFVRFSGCNLWTGLEKDRVTAICQFCDTEFVGTDGQNGGKYSAVELAALVDRLWLERPEGNAYYVPFVVLTGGEPTLQWDSDLKTQFDLIGCEVAMETNGTKVVEPLPNWITVSPKAGTEIKQPTGQELKLVFPQPDLMPYSRTIVEMVPGFDHLYLQPMDGPSREDNTRQAIAYCIANPMWTLSLQQHKILGLD